MSSDLAFSPLFSVISGGGRGSASRQRRSRASTSLLLSSPSNGGSVGPSPVDGNRGQLPSPTPANGSLFPTLPFSFIGKANIRRWQLVSRRNSDGEGGGVFSPLSAVSSEQLQWRFLFPASLSSTACELRRSVGSGVSMRLPTFWTWFMAVATAELINGVVYPGSGKAELMVAEHPDGFDIPRHSLPFGPQQLRFKRWSWRKGPYR
nr:hypothetical protein Iba_chr10eCG11080 [Ipomoea batatas]